MRPLLILLALAASARAQSVVAMVEAPRSVSWRAPAGCPDAASLRARIEQRLARPIDDVALAVEVDVALFGGRYVARVDLRAVTVANDVRTLTSKRCEDIADAVAVIISRIASERAAQRRTVALRAGRSLDEEEVVAQAPAPRPVGPGPGRWAIGGRISGVSAIGVIPKVGLGAELAFTLRHDSTLAEVSGTRWLASAAQSHDGSPARVDVNLDVTAARIGWRPPTMPLRAWLGVEGGTMRGTGVSLPTEQVAGGHWIAAGTGFGVAWQMTSWLRVLGTNEIMIAIERMRFSMGDGLVVYAPSPMSYRAALGVEVGWQ